MRQTLVFVISLILLSGSITALAATHEIQLYELRGYVDPTQTTELPYRIPRLGVNADLLQYDSDDLQQHLSWMTEANVHWVRQFIYWDAIEAEQGQFDFEVLDIIFEALTEYPQLQLIPVFMNSPAWARSSNIATAPPNNPTDIVPFLQAFTERYADQITYYQVWDEPNLDDAWGLSEPRPSEYAALLSESYRAIHSADDNAVVIAAALAPTTEKSGQNIADYLYLQHLYDLGAADYFDAAAGKPYGFSDSPDDRDASPDLLNFSRLILLREVMVANGDARKALWASNWGWNHLPDNWEGDDSIWGETTENHRLDYTMSALQRANREWAWLGGMVLHHWQPNVADDDSQWGFAVIGQDNQQTELWQSLADYKLDNTAQNGLYPVRTPYAQYSGLWTFSELGADIGWLETSDSQLTFDFVGTDIALLLREGDYFAFLYPEVDGETANAIPHDADGNGYILLRSGSQSSELNMVTVSRNLENAPHQLHVIADRGWDQWALAGYAVSDGDLAAPYQYQMQMAWLTLLASLVATMVSGYYLPWRAIYSKTKTILIPISIGWQFGISIATSIALMLSLLMSVGMPQQPLFRRELVDQGLLIILTGGLLVIELPLLLAIIAVLVLFWLIYHHLEWGLILTILYAPFFLFPVELYTFFFPMSELLILITTGAWILHLFIQWGVERQQANSDYRQNFLSQMNILDWLMILWLGLGCLAVTWSVDTDVALTELRTLFIEPFLFYAIFRTIKPSKQTLQSLVLALVVSGILVSLIGIYLYMTGQGVITAEGGARRLASVYGSPNNVGLLLGRVIPFVFATTLIYRKRLRLLAGGLFVFLLGTVALTQSVGAILIGIPAGISTVLLVRFGKRAFPLLLGLLFLGLIVTAGLTQVSTRFASLLDLSSGTNFIRIRVWESSIEILSRYPLTGLGLDQFLAEFSGTYVRPDAIEDPDLSHPHNIVLDSWMRLGLFGVVWLIVISLILWRGISQKIVAYRNDPLFIGGIGALVATVAHGMIDNSIYVIDLAIIFALLMCLAATYFHNEPDATHTE